MKFGQFEFSDPRQMVVTESEHDKQVKALFPVGAKVMAHDYDAHEFEQYDRGIVTKHGVNFLEVRLASGKSVIYALADIKISRKPDMDSLVWLGW